MDSFWARPASSKAVTKVTRGSGRAGHWGAWRQQQTGQFEINFRLANPFTYRQARILSRCHQWRTLYDVTS